MAASDSAGAAAPASATCKNCHARVDGRFCAACGQSVATDIPTVWQLIDELVDGVLNVDSRVWRSVGTLLLRPGRVTRDYLAGRRVRYVSPFRLYLVSSLLFFLFQALSNDLDNSTNAVADGDAPIPGEVDGDVPIPSEADGVEEVAGLSAEEACARAFEGFLPGSAAQGRARTACERASAEGGLTLREEFTQRIPLMIFLLIPVTAAALKLLYAFSGRKYVEHLFFLFHAHAVFFIVLLASLLLGIVGAQFPALSGLGSLFAVAAGIYLPVYGYLALRTMYGQGRAVTVLKYLALIIAYGILMGTVFLGGIAYTALTLPPGT